MAVLFFFPRGSQAETYPQDFGFSRYSQFLLDAGYLWNENSLTHPFNVSLDTLADSSFTLATPYFQPLLNYRQNVRDSKRKAGRNLWVLANAGLELRYQAGDAANCQTAAFQPYIWAVAGFREHWFSQLEVRATNVAASVPHYTGLTRSISRAGFNSAEIDRWTLGYQNDWAWIEYGRGREIRGPMTEDNLALSGESPAFERMVIQGKYKRISYRFFCGFLESIGGDSVNVLRYLIGRTVEYNNHKNLVVGFTELSVLSGENRPVDWSFLNPFALHVEVEQNDRDNGYSEHNQNGLWILDVDYRPIKNLRLAGSVMMDDFQLDQKDRKLAQDQWGFLFHGAWTPLETPTMVTLLMDYTMIGTWTTQHSNGYNNLVSRGRFIGHPIGNDADLISSGFRVVPKYPIALEVIGGKRRTGSNLLSINPYKSYISTYRTSFPSGSVTTERFTQITIDSQPLDRLCLGIKTRFSFHRNSGGRIIVSDLWEFTLRYALDFRYLD